MEFFKALALSHTVQVAQSCCSNTVNKSYQYQASSPDEKALLEACAQLGLYYLNDENEDVIKLEITSSNKESSEFMKFKILHILEFSSERKRMSVIVSDQNGDNWLYTKGAENVVFELCSENCKDMILKTNQHITDFALQGLRTLAIAKRPITQEEYEEFLHHLQQAQTSLDKRKELLENCYKNIEKGRSNINSYNYDP